MKVKQIFGKIMLNSFGKILPNKPFRKLRVHWSRMISECIDKKANIQKGAHISGNGTNLVVESHAAIGINCRVSSNVFIGSGTIMGPDCLILSQNHFYDKEKNRLDGYIVKPVYIGKKCWIGAKTIILPGARIGNNCIVGAGSVVTNKQFPDFCLIAGNPATIKKKLL